MATPSSHATPEGTTSSYSAPGSDGGSASVPSSGTRLVADPLGLVPSPTVPFTADFPAPHASAPAPDAGDRAFSELPGDLDAPKLERWVTWMGRSPSGEALSEEQAARLHQRILAEVETWHSRYREVVRAEREAQEARARERTETTTPLPLTPDAMIGVRTTRPEDVRQRAVRFVVGPRRRRFTMRFAPGYRAGVAGHLSFESADPELAEVLASVNDFASRNAFDNLSHTVQAVMEELVRAYFRIRAHKHRSELLSVHVLGVDGAASEDEDDVLSPTSAPLARAESDGSLLLDQGTVVPSLLPTDTLMEHTWGPGWNEADKKKPPVDPEVLKRSVHDQLHALQRYFHDHPEMGSVSASDFLFHWEVELFFPTDTPLGQQLRAHAAKFRVAPSIRLAFRFPSDFPARPPVVRIRGPVLLSGTGLVLQGAFVSPLLYRTPPSARGKNRARADSRAGGGGGGGGGGAGGGGGGGAGGGGGGGGGLRGSDAAPDSPASRPRSASRGSVGAASEGDGVSPGFTAPSGTPVTSSPGEPLVWDPMCADPGNVVALVRLLREHLLRYEAAVDSENPRDYDRAAWQSAHERLRNVENADATVTRKDYDRELEVISASTARLFGIRFPTTLDAGNKIILPNQVPVDSGGSARTLEITPLGGDRLPLPTPCGFLQGTAPEGMVIVSDAMMKSMMLKEHTRVRVRTVELPKIMRVRLRAHRGNWSVNAPVPPMPFLREGLKHFAALAKGDTVTLRVTQSDYGEASRYRLTEPMEATFFVEDLKPDAPAAKMWTDFFLDLKVDFGTPMDAVDEGPGAAATGGGGGALGGGGGALGGGGGALGGSVGGGAGGGALGGAGRGTGAAPGSPATTAAGWSAMLVGGSASAGAGESTLERPPPLASLAGASFGASGADLGATRTTVSVRRAGTTERELSVRVTLPDGKQGIVEADSSSSVTAVYEAVKELFALTGSAAPREWDLVRAGTLDDTGVLATEDASTATLWTALALGDRLRARANLLVRVRAAADAAPTASATGMPASGAAGSGVSLSVAPPADAQPVGGGAGSPTGVVSPTGASAGRGSSTGLPATAPPLVRSWSRRVTARVYFVGVFSDRGKLGARMPTVVFFPVDEPLHELYVWAEKHFSLRGLPYWLRRVPEHSKLPVSTARSALQTPLSPLPTFGSPRPGYGSGSGSAGSSSDGGGGGRGVGGAAGGGEVVKPPPTMLTAEELAEREHAGPRFVVTEEWGTFLPDDATTLEQLGVRGGDDLLVEQFVEPLHECAIESEHHRERAILAHWTCVGCTYMNECTRFECEMCGTNRPGPDARRLFEQATELLKKIRARDHDRSRSPTRPAAGGGGGGSVPGAVATGGGASGHEELPPIVPGSGAHAPLQVARWDGERSPEVASAPSIVTTYVVGFERLALSRNNDCAWLRRLLRTGGLSAEEIQSLDAEFVLKNRNAVVL